MKIRTINFLNDLCLLCSMPFLILQYEPQITQNLQNLFSIATICPSQAIERNSKFFCWMFHAYHNLYDQLTFLKLILT
jgi:hypothetical protein